MSSIIEFLAGKKTYLIGAIIFILGGLGALGFQIPPDVYALLGSLGLIANRAAIAKVQ